MTNPLVRPITRFYFRLRRQARLARYDRLVLEELDGVPLLVLPQVFNGVLLRTGSALARSLSEGIGQIPGQASELTALDLGTGCGIGAIFAARLGMRVVGIDVNPEAVRCARINVLLNQLERQVEIRHGDLFEPVAGERFDLVLFNPPFYRGVPRDALDQAWRADGVFERFARDLPAVLNPTGLALIVLSTDGDGEALLDALRARDFELRQVAAQDLGNEVITVYSASARP